MSRRRFSHFSAPQSLSNQDTNRNEISGDFHEHQGIYIPPSVRDNTIDTSPFDPLALSYGMPVNWSGYTTFRKETESILNDMKPIDVMQATAEFKKPNAADPWGLPKNTSPDYLGFGIGKMRGPKPKTIDPWSVPETFPGGISVGTLPDNMRSGSGKFLRVEYSKQLPQKYYESGHDFIAALYRRK